MAYGFPKWMDGGFNIPIPVSLPVLSSPIPATTAQYLLTQDWMVHINSFAPLPLNLPHPNPDFKDFVLVSEGPREDQGGGIVKWKRTYAKVPDTYDEFDTYNYNFIGFAAGGDVAVAGSPLRNRQSHPVPSRTRFEFFLVDSAGIVNPTDGRIYRSPGDIRIISALRYYLVDQLTPTNNPSPWPVDLIEDSPPYNQPTSPKLASYKAWIANAQNPTIGFNGDTVDGLDPDGFNPGTKGNWHGQINPSQFCVEDSTIKRWMGNIWMRISRTVLAQ